MNMSDLDNLNKKLKDSMTVLDVQGATGNQGGASGIQGINVDSPDFGKSPKQTQPMFGGHTTFKTDVQRASLNQDMNEFR